MTSFDLFLSYHRSDRESVEKVRQILNAHGVSTFIDYMNLTPGLPWPQALEQALRSVQAVAVFVGPELGLWQKREMYFALDRQAEEERAGRSFQVIPVILPQADLTSGFLFLNTWIDLRNDLTSADSITALVKAIRTGTGVEVPQDARDEAAQLCPYQGLKAFREEHAAFFSGREEFSQRLLEKVRSEKGLVGVIGPSGSGKSSIVHAGLLPLLRRQRPPAKTWDAVSFTPGQQPFRSLAAVMIPLLEPGMTETDRLEQQGKLSNLLATGTVLIEDVVKRIIEKSKGTDRVLVIIDQLEELMTLATAADRLSFVQRVVGAIGRAPLEFVLTVRADFYGHVIGLSRELSDRLEERVVNVGPMTKPELERAVVEPAKKVGLSFEPGLVNRLLNDSGQEPGQLPLVEFALSQLFDGRRGRLMTHAAYEAFGGVAKAINNFADAQLANFRKEEQASIRRIFTRLVRVTSPGETGEDTRRRALISELDEGARPLIDKLADARLLVTARTEITGEETVEVSHEALIREWKTFRAWLNEDREFLLWRQRLGLSLAEWQRKERDEGGLLRGALLTEAKRWQASRAAELNEDEQEFILVSVALQQKELFEKEEQLRKREQLRRSRMRVLAAGLVITLLLAIALGMQWRRTLKEGRIALARGLLSRAILVTNTERSKFDQAALLAIESLRLETTPGAEAILRDAIALLPEEIGRPSQIDCATETATFSAGGSFLACVNYTTRTVKIIAVTSGKQLTDLPVAQYEKIRRVEASPDGKFLGIGLRGGFKLYDAHTQPPQVVTELATSDTEGSDSVVAFSGNGEYFAAAVFNPATRRTTIQLFSIPGGHLSRDFKFDSRILALTFSSDGALLATLHDGDISTKVTIFDLTGTKSPATIEGGAAIASLAVSKDGSWIAVPELDSLRVTDTQTKQVYRLSHEKRPHAVALSEDGLYAASAGEDGAARVMETATDRLIALIPTGAPVKAVAFTPDNNLALVSEDKIVRTVNVLARAAFESLPIGIKGISPGGRYFTTFIGGSTPGLAIVDRLTISRPLKQPVNRWTVPLYAEDPLELPNLVRDLLISGTVGYSFDEEHFVATSGGYGMTAYDIKTRKTHHEPPVAGLVAEAISGDGKMVGWATARQIEILHAENGTRKDQPIEFVDTRALKLSRDGGFVAASSGKNRTLAVFDVIAGKQIFHREMESVVLKAAFSSNGRYLAASSQDKDLILVDLQTGGVVGPLKNVETTLLLFSNDNSILAAGGGREAQRIRADSPEGQFPFAINVIETATGKVLSTMQIAKEAVGAAFSSDGRSLDVVDDTSLTRHYLRTEDLIAKTCSILTRNLRQDEWSFFMTGLQYRPTCGNR